MRLASTNFKFSIEKQRMKEINSNKTIALKWQNLFQINLFYNNLI
jgi:hypothetical protein